MIHLSKSAFAVGGVVLAAGLIGMTNPKTVHALAAALVQVTNTASNPVVTQSVHEQAGQIVHLECSPNTSQLGGGKPCVLVDGSMTEVGILPPPKPVYVVPANQSLVITSVNILPQQLNISASCSAIHSDWLYVQQNPTAGYYPQFWAVNNLSMQFTYPSGIVVGAGLSIYTGTSYLGYVGSCNSETTDPTDLIDVYGYLTAA